MEAMHNRPLDVEGPVQAEIFVIWLNGDRLEATGPHGADAWIVELAAGDHPLQTVDAVVRRVIGPPRLVHSTSWRRDRDAVILSFLVVIGPEQRGGMASAPIGRAELARSGATAPPEEIGSLQVLEHALRHLSWLAREDPVVRAELSTDWHRALAPYTPEPFRALA